MALFLKPHHVNRRQFIQLGALASTARAAVNSPPKIAAITTAFFLRSHADDIITRELEGYWINDKFYSPPIRIASLYQDQIHPADVGEKLAKAYGSPVKKSIAEALTLGS